MDDLSAKINEILSDEESMNQVRSLAQMLGMGGEGDGSGSSAPSSPQEPASAPPSQSSPANSGNGGFDTDAVSSLLGALSGGGNSGSPPSQEGGTGNGGFDIGAISSLLGSLNGGGNSGSSTSTGSGDNALGDFMKNIDVGKLMRVQQLLSDNRDDKNTALLLALKPHLSDARQDKVDNAIRMMKLTKLLPLISESGLFGGGNS